MKDKIVRGDVVVKYTVLDELLTDIICDYYFDRNEPHYARLWKTKRFRVFVHYLMDETYLLKKLTIVHAIRAVPKDVRAAIARINDVRNDLAHSSFLNTVAATSAARRLPTMAFVCSRRRG
jgi:hypothetical protein